MAILKTYDLKGNKLSFANWISNLSPTETPFTSMINKEKVDQIMYSWQVDRLASPDNKAEKEGSAFVSPVLAATQVKTNFTQILRKVVKVTDTANTVGLYGRPSEKAYQVEKAGKEIRRDLELMCLTNDVGQYGSKTVTRKMGGFVSLVAPIGQKDPDTGAVVHKIYKATAADEPFTEHQIFDMTYNLYLAGSKANKIMVHPKYMAVFSAMIGGHTADGVRRMFDGLEAKYNAYVKSIRDPLGQVFEIIPNRFMPEDKIFFFNENDWTQMVLREPKLVELAKTGSAEKHMIEMEMGLRHRNPFASGVLELRPNAGGAPRKTYSAVMDTNPDVPVTSNRANCKVSVQAWEDGVVSTTATDNTTITAHGCKLGGTQTLTTSDNTTSSVLVNGKKDFFIRAEKAGHYNVEIKATDGSYEPLNLLYQVNTLRMADGSEELVVESVEVEAPKSRKAKAKAE